MALKIWRKANEGVFLLKDGEIITEIKVEKITERSVDLVFTAFSDINIVRDEVLSRDVEGNGAQKMADFREDVR